MSSRNAKSQDTGVNTQARAVCVRQWHTATEHATLVNRQVFWDVTHRCWPSVFRRVEESKCLQLQGYALFSDSLIMKMKATRSFETSVNTRHIPEDVKLSMPLKTLCTFS